MRAEVYAGADEISGLYSPGSIFIDLADLDGDSDLEIITVSTGTDEMVWYDNLGAGTYGPQEIIS